MSHSANDRAENCAPFALVHLAWFTGWLVINTGHLFRFKPFGPFPFQVDLLAEQELTLIL
jgi:hypothetical protein